MAKNVMNFSRGRIEVLALPVNGQRLEFHDTQAKGLLLRITSTGTKTFCFYRWIKGSAKPERITLGRFPAMTVEQARSKAARKRPVVPPVLTPPKQSSLLFFNEDEQWPYQNSGSIISKPGNAAV